MRFIRFAAMTEPATEGAGESVAPVQAEPGFVIGLEPFVAEIDPQAPDAEEGAETPAPAGVLEEDARRSAARNGDTRSLPDAAAALRQSASCWTSWPSAPPRLSDWHAPLHWAPPA